MKEVIVIGAGAAGMTAAIAAAEEGARVTVLEGMKKPGRKLLLTGNGRCNLTNLDPALPEKYHSDDPKKLEVLTKEVFSAFSVQDTLRFFKEMGLSFTDRDGWVYPASGQASAVLNALLRELKRLSVTLRYDAKVSAIRYDKESRRWMAKVGDWEYSADSLILCCGSRAAEATGSDGSGYALARMAGHTVIPPVPALTAVICKDPGIAVCAGARTRGTVTILPDGPSESGEIQWTENGISGIAVFQLSRLVSKAAAEGRTVPMRIDLVPGQSRETAARQLKDLISRYQGTEKLSRLLTGFVPDRISSFLIRKSGMSEQELAGKDPETTAELLSGLLKELPLTAGGTRSFDASQVCAGGVRLGEIDGRTLASRIAPELYFAGEILDVDGMCGGFNLQWAWSSGHTAGKAAAGS